MENALSVYSTGCVKLCKGMAKSPCFLMLLHVKHDKEYLANGNEVTFVDSEAASNDGIVQ